MSRHRLPDWAICPFCLIEACAYLSEVNHEVELKMVRYPNADYFHPWGARVLFQGEERRHVGVRWQRLCNCGIPHYSKMKEGSDVFSPSRLCVPGARWWEQVQLSRLRLKRSDSLAANGKGDAP
jgi:hypothetical protein